VSARRWLWALAGALVLLGSLLTPLAARADVAPDVLDSYSIAITPQADGMLSMDYTLTGYHVMSDWPSNEPYLQIGVPNESFSITNASYGGEIAVSNVRAVDGGGSFVEFDFGTLPRTGDVFDLHFTITQGAMAYPDTSNNEVTFGFIPSGWTFPITVEQLTVSWASPSNPSLLKLVQPSPTNGVMAMTWLWDSPAVNSYGMFEVASVELAYDQSAFTLSDAATAHSAGDNGDYSGGNSGDSGSSGSGSAPGTVIFVIFVIFVFAAAAATNRAGDNYNGGPGIHPGGRGFIGGGFGGGGCACAGCACACACACAGGGRVGCSRKAIGIECLPRIIRTMTKSDEISLRDTRD